MDFIIRLPDSIYFKEPETWSRFAEAFQEMLDRMAMSYFKYHENFPIYESIKDEQVMLFVHQRMAMYDGGMGENLCTCTENNRIVLPQQKKHELYCWLTKVLKLNTGNTENLIDAANGLILERIFPQHKKAHFKSQTSEESPGITLKD